MFSLSTFGALVTRQLLIYTRNPVRAVELFFWPIVQLLVWGFVTMYLQKQAGGGADDFPRFITFLIGAIILWDALFRSQQGVAISFLEDVWTRNLLNVFAAPIRMTEYLGASFAVGALRVFITGIVLALIAIVAYSFNILQFQWMLFVFYGNLLMFGWTLGILSTALVLRWGHGAESLAWAIPFMIQPFACVFYDVTVLPAWMKGVALAMPPAHVFEGMRGMIATGSTDLRSLSLAAGLNVFYMAFAGWLFARTLATARVRGLLVKTASS